MSTVKKEAMRDRFSEVILDLAKNDDRVYAVDGDLANSTKIDIVAMEKPEKFLQMGIAEQNMLSVCSGLASTGLQPWAVTFAAFLSKRALDQIQVQIAQPKLNVKMVGAYSGLLTGLTGKTHQALEDIAIFRTLANMVVIAPADSVEVEKVMRAVNQYDGPVYIRLARDAYPYLFEEDYEFEIGKAVTLREGKDVSIISTGTQTSRSVEAAERLAEKGISVEVVHMPTIKPLDEAAIVATAKKTNLVVSAEEHSILGGLGSAVAEVLGERYPTQLLRIGVEDRNAESAPNEELLNKYGLSVEHMVTKISAYYEKYKK
ncbi:MAG TPA: transketolase C-terminal domain-containing protein [Cerasibacillus sp.]|uniref:transketolase family protein n=1 Tax=Cerasibacillus sp. TaxID=2498711 RepID=UPI002F412C98